MAIYWNEETYCKLGNPNTTSIPTVTLSYDDDSDIPNLPGLDKVKGGSAAINVYTGKILMLGKDGWKGKQ